MLACSEGVSYESNSKYDSYTNRKISSVKRQINKAKRSMKKAARLNQNRKKSRFKRELRKHKIVLNDYKGRTILGRWIPQGFEDAIRYQFTRTSRFTIYSDNGSFPTLADFLYENPGISGHEWSYEGRRVVVDLNFGNFLRLTPRFSRNNNVIEWISDGGSVHSTFIRER
jgi:hypothetical protein